MIQMRQAVKTLPPQTVILLPRLYRDAAGGAFIPPQAAQLIAEAANAPLYVLGAVNSSVTVCNERLSVFRFWFQMQSWNIVALLD